MNEPPVEDPELGRTLVRIVRETRWLSEVLEAVRAVAPPGWYVAAGAVRNTVWDSLSGIRSEGPLGDIDIVYFDVEDTPALYGAPLRARFPEYEWEITNQAFVHRWQGRARGRTVEPFRSVADAIGAWPETATAVGVTLDHEGELGVLAPLGLGDLFSMTVRCNERMGDPETYRARVDQKRWHERWPHLKFVPP